MPSKPRCRAKDPATCKTHGTPVVGAARVDLMQALVDSLVAARVPARQSRKQMLVDLLDDVNAGRVRVVDGRTYVGRRRLDEANVDLLAYEVERAAREGVAAYGVGDPVEAVNAAWTSLVDTYDVNHKDEAPIIRDNESTLRNALLERVHAAAY